VGGEVLVEALEMSGMPRVGEMDEGGTGLEESLQDGAAVLAVATLLLKTLPFCLW